MSEQISTKSEAELLDIIRRAENTDVPGSRYQKAVKELELRDRQKVKQGPVSGVFLRVGGDMVMDGGSIQSDQGAIDIMVAGKYKSRNGTIKQGTGAQAKVDESIWRKWWMEFLVYPFIVGCLLLVVPTIRGWVLALFGF